MRYCNLSRKFLVRFVLLVPHFAWIIAGNVDFYQDVIEPDRRGMDLNYEEMARYLEAQKMAKMRFYLDNRRERQIKILEALIENQGILEALEESRKAKEHQMTRQLPWEVADESASFRGLEETSRPFTRSSNVAGPYQDEDYTNPKYPYAKSIFPDDQPQFSHQLPNYPVGIGPFDEDEDEDEVNYPDEPQSRGNVLKWAKNFLKNNKNPGNNLNEDETRRTSGQEPEFTYKFDDKPEINERDIFAIKPNDPRYYQADIVGDTDNAVIDEKKVLEEADSTSRSVEVQTALATGSGKPATIDDLSWNNDKFNMMKIVEPEAHKQIEDDSVVVTASRFMREDIYFIAIVAGCCAVAMFALVLIGLMWCRLHRGAKAAADIEYPAYGVTGPNKDISPSGDQRLAHSAQMYHFQHQKQQIIAMEKTAASRDPGSVSEAESDEENEEGDYTVYECPGLASTGEMEVKNPMFHDDPTPATPPLNHKDEDHN